MVNAPLFRAGQVGQRCGSRPASRPGQALAAAFMARLITAGVTPTRVQRLAVDRLATMVARIGQTRFVAVYPFIGGTAATHALNLVSTNYALSFTGGITHDANGYTSDGTTGWADTGIAHAQRPANYHLSMYQRTLATMVAPGVGWAWYASTKNFALGGWSNGWSAGFSGGWDDGTYGSHKVEVNVTGTRLISSSANSNTDFRLYIHGTEVGNYLSARVETTDANTMRLSRDTANSYFVGHSLGFVSLGANLTGPEQAYLAAEVHAVQQILGRSV
jgi:hypothetical protein